MENKKQRRKRRSFTAEFRAEAVRLCKVGDRSVTQVAKDLDLTENSLREWVKRADIDAGSGPPGALTTAEREELELELELIARRRRRDMRARISGRVWHDFSAEPRVAREQARVERLDSRLAGGREVRYRDGGAGHSSGTRVAARLERPTRELGRAALERSSMWPCSSFAAHAPACSARARVLRRARRAQR